MIRIMTEAMSDLTREDAMNLNVALVAQPLRFGMEEYLDDGHAINRHEFFDRMRASAELPHTSMVPMGFWLDAFNKYLRDPETHLVVIAGSSKLSGGHHAAELAMEDCDAPERVTLIDSMNASCGEALLVVEAARLRDEGASAQEIAERLENLKGRQIVRGLADDLKYLVMGGRLSPLVGKIGGALNIKPTLKIENGVIDKAGVVRGVKKGYAWYIEELKAHKPDPSVPLYIGGADCDEVVELLRQMVQDAGIDVQVRTMGVGCLIGAHVGPGLTLMSWVTE